MYRPNIVVAMCIKLHTHVSFSRNIVGI